MFKRPSLRYARTPEPATPYQRAAQVWDERIGSARVQARSWRLACFGALALSAGRALQFPGAVALLTAGYSVGQIVGPVAVAPLLHNGFRQALLAGAGVVLLAALAALLMWISGRQPRVVDADRGDVAREGLDDGVNGRVVFSPSPHQ